MEYRSPALMAAQRLAETIGKHPSVPACIRSQPGPERLELALLCAGKLPMTFAPGGMASDPLLLDLVSRAAAQTEPHAVFADSADRMLAQVSEALIELPRHCKLIISSAQETYTKVHRGLRAKTIGHTIDIPPISARREDAGPLILAALAGLQSRYEFDGITQEAWDVLMSHAWTDTRWLLEAVQRGALYAYLERERLISLRHLPEHVLSDSPHGFLDIPMARNWDQRTLIDNYVLHVIARSESKAEAARRLGITTQALYSRLARLTGVGRAHSLPARDDRPHVPVQPPPVTSETLGEIWERAGSGPPMNPSKGYSRTFGAPHTEEQHRHMQEAAARALHEHAEAAEQAGKDPEGKITLADLRALRIEEKDGNG